MNLFAVIRIAAGVGLSVINAISAVKHVKEANEMGLISLHSYRSFNNSTSYGYNNNCNDMSSRRYSVPSQPAYSQPVNPFVGYGNTQPQTTYSHPQPMMSVRPIMNVTPYVQPAPPCQMSYQINMPRQCDMSSRRFSNPTQNYYQNPTQSYYQNPSPTVNINQSWKGNYGYDSLDGLENIGRRNQYQQPFNNNVNYQNNWNYQRPVQTQTYNEPKWCDKSIGQMQEESLRNQQLYQYQQYQQSQPKHHDPLVNWQSDRYRWRPEQAQGVVPMFTAPDGTPLWSL